MVLDNVNGYPAVGAVRMPASDTVHFVNDGSAPVATTTPLVVKNSVLNAWVWATFQLKLMAFGAEDCAMTYAG